MNAHYDVLDVVPDTDAWLEERRNSIGASEIAAVLGESAFEGSTPYSVFLDKLGAGKQFDPLLSYVTHAAENLISGWVERFHPEIGRVLPGFMARSVRYPWLHATFDRLLERPDGRVVPLQLKTSNSHARRKWDEGVLPDYLAQEDVETLIMDPDGDEVDEALLVVWHFDTNFQLFRLPRRAEAQRLIVERSRDFYENHMLTRVPPSPILGDDMTAIYPGERGKTVTATEEVLDAVGILAITRFDKNEAVAEFVREEDRQKFIIEKFMGDATELKHPYSQKLLHTWRPRVDGVRIHKPQKEATN